MRTELSQNSFLPFSNPLEIDDKNIKEITIITVYRDILQKTINKNRSIIDKYSTGLFELFEFFLSHSFSYKLYINHSVTRLEKANYESTDSFINALADLACNLTAEGLDFKWSINYDYISALNFKGIIIENMSFEAIKHELNSNIVFTSKDKKIFELKLNSQLNDELFYQSSKTSNNEFNVLPLNKTPTEFKDRIMLDYVRYPELYFLDKVNLAVRILKEKTPSYYKWVCDITNTIIVYHTESESYIKSGSWEDSLSQYNISVNHDQYVIAEMLVHESSHQYFNIFKKIENFASNDDAIYFSPAVNKERPLWLILLAYHAFANVLLFYRLLNESSDIIKQREVENEDLVNKLSKHLENNSNLTPSGKMIYESLKKQIQKI